MTAAQAAKGQGSVFDGATDDALEGLREMYLEGANKDIFGLEEQLARIQKDKGIWSEACKQMREITHNVKGQGTSFGYPLMTKVGTSLSRLLKLIETPGDKDIKLVGAHISALRIVLDKDIQGSGGQLGIDLVRKLEDLVDQKDA